MDRGEYLRIAEGLVKELVYRHPIKDSGILKIKKKRGGRSRASLIEEKYLQKTIKDGYEFDFEGDTATYKVSSGSRDWIDFSIKHKEVTYYYNLKVGKGETGDNIGGLSYIRYLICNNPKRPKSEVDFCQEIVDLDRKYDLEARDYILVALQVDTGEITTIPVGAIHHEDIKSNPRNIFQTNPHNARRSTRTQEEAIEFLVGKFIKYTEKKAESFGVFRKDMLEKGMFRDEEGMWRSEEGVMSDMYEDQNPPDDDPR